MGTIRNARLITKSVSIYNNSVFDINLRYYQNNADKYINNTINININDLYNDFIARLPQNNATILDAGCGSGRDSVYFKRLGYKIIAIDASSEMVKSAKKYGINAKVLKIQNIKYDNMFDAIWTCAVLLHIPRNEIVDVIRKLFLALKPGGVILITVKEGRGENYSSDGRFFINYGFREFASLLKKAGEWAYIESMKLKGGGGNKWLKYIAKKKDMKLYSYRDQIP